MLARLQSPLLARHAASPFRCVLLDESHTLSSNRHEDGECGGGRLWTRATPGASARRSLGEVGLTPGGHSPQVRGLQGVPDALRALHAAARRASPQGAAALRHADEGQPGDALVAAAAAQARALPLVR